MKLHKDKDLRRHKTGQAVYHIDIDGMPTGMGIIVDVYYSSMAISWDGRRSILCDYNDDALWNRIVLCCSRV